MARHALREEDTMPKKIDIPEPKDVDELDADTAADASDGCNVEGCERDPEIRGLCSAHWATHRGLAGHKEKP